MLNTISRHFSRGYSWFKKKSGEWNLGLTRVKSCFRHGHLTDNDMPHIHDSHR